ncbi:hypothetical protein ACFL0P_02260 [Candidatus Omnitrophota bacterium]
MKRKAIFIFTLSFLVYLLYFLEANPGHYSLDVVDGLQADLQFWDLKNFIRIYQPSFYIVPASLFYLIAQNLAALGLFQILLVSAINTYTWLVLAKFSKVKIAWAVVLLMIFSPLNGCMTLWYHRSSLFGWLVFLNLVLLYKFSKVQRFKNLERVIFLINLLFISFLRMDGIIVSLSSLFIYTLKSKEQKWIKIAMLAGLILMLYSSFEDRDCPTQKALLFIYPVQRIHQSTGVEFTDKDKQVLKRIVLNESDRKIWLEGQGWFDFNLINRDMTQNELDNFAKWSSVFITKNLFHFIKSQAEVFLGSSLFGGRPNYGFYFYHNNPSKKERNYVEIKTIDIKRYSYIKFPGKIAEFIYRYAYLDLNNPISIFVFLMLSAFMPFVFVFVYSVIAFKRNRRVLIPLIPLLLYSIFMFLFQPLPKAYYWYWLVYSYSFIVLGLGYETISRER